MYNPVVSVFIFIFAYGVSSVPTIPSSNTTPDTPEISIVKSLEHRYDRTPIILPDDQRLELRKPIEAHSGGHGSNIQSIQAETLPSISKPIQSKSNEKITASTPSKTVNFSKSYSSKDVTESVDTPKLPSRNPHQRSLLERPAENSNILGSLTSNNGSILIDLVNFVNSSTVQNYLKHLVSDFYPATILNALEHFQNKNGSSNFTVSVAYPLVMEGLSLLINRLTGNETDNSTSINEDSPIRGKIVYEMIGSLNKLLDSNNIGNNNDRLNHPLTNITKLPTTSPNYLDDIQIKKLGSGLLKYVYDLYDWAQNNTAWKTLIGGIVKNGIMDVKRLTASALNFFPDYGTNKLKGLFNQTSLFTTFAQSHFNSSGQLNVTHLLEKFMPDNSNSSGMSKTLQSGFIAKVLDKSPVAYLGALDEDIKRLVTSSLDRAMSRIKINEKGQIEMSEGMRKMVSKIIDNQEAKNLPNQLTQDPLIKLLKMAIKSGSTQVIDYSTLPDDGTPRKRRNVTRHSHLHRRFQEKYGKSYQKSASSSVLFGSFDSAVLLLSLVAGFSCKISLN